MIVCFLKNNQSHFIEKTLFLYIELNCKRAIQQSHSITLTNAHKCQRQILHPQKLVLYSKLPPFAELLTMAVREALLRPACLELAGALEGKKTMRGAEVKLTRSRLLRPITRTSLNIMCSLSRLLCLLSWVFLFVLNK